MWLCSKSLTIFFANLVLEFFFIFIYIDKFYIDKLYSFTVICTDAIFNAHLNCKPGMFNYLFGENNFVQPVALVVSFAPIVKKDRKVNNLGEQGENLY